jgi:hypothetical protein
MTLQTTLERLKREKLEMERKASESQEERAQMRASMKQAGRDAFDKDLDNMSYETLDGLVHRSDSATIRLTSMPKGVINETDLDRLRSVLGNQLHLCPRMSQCLLSPLVTSNGPRSAGKANSRMLLKVSSGEGIGHGGKALTTLVPSSLGDAITRRPSQQLAWQPMI